ncbi:MAG: preprotein translocase subunit YajC [Chloroflexi bacterium]|nr:preprotein translocase subunit YajC [Chloroflexota bacterium]
METLIGILIVLVLFYIWLILPHQLEARRHKKVLSMVRPGDEVVTQGGLVGKITSLEERVVHLEVAPGVVIRVHRDFLYRIVAPPPETDQETDTPRPASG